MEASNTRGDEGTLQKYVWDNVKLPKEKKAAANKCLQLKHKANNCMQRHKARLVAKGFTTTCGIDHKEAFAPLLNRNQFEFYSLRANLGWPLVKNAFYM